MRTIRSHNFLLLICRIALLFFIFAFCRLVFGVYNKEYFIPVTINELPSILKGGYIFDSISIFYINIPFIILSLLPFRFREKRNYQKVLMWLFIVVNALGLMVNIADIFYYPFKLARIASDDLHLLGEGNLGALGISFIKDYWGGLVLWVLCIVLLWRGFIWLRYEPQSNRPLFKPAIFVISQLLLLLVAGIFIIFSIRGYSFSAASYPIGMNDASLYVKPKYASLILSNPFCLIRTAKQSVPSPKYFPEYDLDRIYPVMHSPMDSVALKIEGSPNIVLLVLESFGSAHLKSFSDRYDPGTPSITPFIDSLASVSYIFTDAYQNGIRSIDAMPAIWASIPSFKTQFLSLPNSVAQYKALPECLMEMGYSTQFLHGAVRKSMSFVSFGQMAGVEEFYSREDYEAENGTTDFDGKWGIWDHKFLPYAVDKMSDFQQPFFSTIFTLSSHHPYQLPPGMEGKFPEGTMDIHRVIAYSDNALKNFFDLARQQDWYDNTLFIVTADHGSGADNEKYLNPPYAYSVPIIMHYTGSELESDYFSDGKLSGVYQSPAQHINIMPTLLRVLGYNDNFFAFGRDMFNEKAGFAINYFGGSFNFVTNEKLYVFNETQTTGIYHKTDSIGELVSDEDLLQDDIENIEEMKGFIQQYYSRIKERNFIY